jgi:SAM-dependent methyltransferase
MERADFLKIVSSRTPEIPKERFILERCRSRTVLDLGCVDHTAETALSQGDDWLHKQICEVASAVVGVDIAQDAAAQLNDAGFNIVATDVEKLNLGTTFEVIVAGDLIEHLSNIGSFMDAVSKHMTPESRFIITTPNPFNMEQFTQGVFRQQTMVNDQHTVSIDPQAMFEIVRRSPFEITGFAWIDTRFHFRLKGGRLLRRIVNPVTALTMARRPLVRRDYAIVLKLASATRP